ncbi:MAG: helix-turn-helix transcriptional regulator, partial [Armatimonadota bacterium]|nr:helix-turn-helix transcriptional regulator [Armatimonadota bacterium]
SYLTHDEYLKSKLSDPEFAEAFAQAQRELEFAVSLSRLREAQGWTQSDLEAHSGVPQETISRIERGRIPAVSTLKRLAKALNASVLILPDDRVLFQPYAG